MTEKQIEYYRKGGDDGTIPDDLNPLYIFHSVHPDILSAIIRGDYDMRMLAAYQLANSGLSPEGKWVGFKEAERLRLQLFKSRRKSKAKKL